MTDDSFRSDYAYILYALGFGLGSEKFHMVRGGLFEIFVNAEASINHK